MGKHHRRDNDDTDIIAEVVAVEEPMSRVAAGDFHLAGDFKPMFRGFDVDEDKPVLTEHRHWSGPLIMALLGAIMALVALTLVIWVWLHTGGCVR